jgi:hypothetical protein
LVSLLAVASIFFILAVENFMLDLIQFPRWVNSVSLLVGTPLLVAISWWLLRGLLLHTCEPREDTPNVLSASGGLYKQVFGKDDDGAFYELRSKLGDYFYNAEIPAFRWWEQTVEIKGSEVGNPGRHVYRRVDVAKGIAEHDGGAHFASRIPESYDVLSRPGGLIKITIGEEGNTQDVPIAGVHLAMLRQIAYEALNSRALLKLAQKGKW